MISTLDRVAGVIRVTFGVDDLDVTPETIAEDVPGWDSLSHTILILSLEDEFDVELPHDTRGFANVGVLVALLERLTS
jgi:acyl carrier protein